MILTAALAATLALLEYFLYFHSNAHFFQGDSLYYFGLRYSTVKDFLLGFLSLDPAGWYRPLTARTVQSLLYPWFGFQTTPYRIVHYLLFMSTMLALYKLAAVVTRRRAAAWLITFFFGVQIVNGWTTYDVLFVPELVFTFFYITAAAAYLRYRQTQNPRLLWMSAGCFLLSLCSKETALTLPLMLVALDIILNRARFKDSIKSASVHFAVLALYIVLVIGFLGVQRPAFRSILKRPGPEIAYRFALDQTIADNAHFAVTWVFNIPRGWQTESRQLQGVSITLLKLFRLGALIIGLWVILFRPERRVVMAGIAWFVIGIGPALPLFEHFMPYYLFMPTIGFSIAIGTIADALYRRLSDYNTPIAAVSVGAPLVAVAVICTLATRHDVRDNRVLGRSSRLAESSLSDLKQAHPTLQPNTTIYFSDAEEPDLAWDIAQGALFQMAYRDDTLRTLHWGWGEVITKGVLERGPVVVMKYHNFHLSDVTQEFMAASEPAVAYIKPKDHVLDLHPDSATVGQHYQLAISMLSKADVTLHYTLDGGPVQAFTAHLDDRGEAAFEIMPATSKGVYKFVGFQIAGTAEWYQAASSIRIY